MLNDYRRILQTELVKRIQANPSYSLRAFARDLDIANSRLSRILRNEEGISPSRAKDLCKRLGLNSAESREFCCLVEMSDSRSKVSRKKAESDYRQMMERGALNAPEVRQITQDKFDLISDWYHFAILELTHVKGFQARAPWISKALGISLVEAKDALDRLFRLGLLERNRGRVVKKDVIVSAGDEAPSEAIRVFNERILDLAARSIRAQDSNERYLSTVTLPVSRKNVGLISKKIAKMRREFNLYVEKLERDAGSKPDEVYCLSSQFFRLTQKRSRK